MDRSAGTSAGPGRCSDPKGNCRLCQTATRPITTSAAPATRSVVSIARRSLLRALDLADLRHDGGEFLRVGLPEGVELVGVLVGDRRVEAGGGGGGPPLPPGHTR